MVSSSSAAYLGAVLLVAVAGPWMRDAEIEAAFKGKTIEGVYASGLPFTETYAEGGHTNYSEPTRELTGRWSIVSGSFCTLYDDASSGGCFKVRRIGDNCFEFFVNALSEAEAATDPEPAGWTARGWRKGERASCDNVPSA